MKQQQSQLVDSGLSDRILGTINTWITQFYLYWFPSKDKEVLCSHHHEAHKLVAQNLLDLVSLVRVKEKRCFPKADILGQQKTVPWFLTQFPPDSLEAVGFGSENNHC